MQLGRQTDVPEVDSYFHKSSVRPFPFRPAAAHLLPRVRDHGANVVSYVDADIGYNGVWVAVIIRSLAKGISHGCYTAKVCDAVGI